MKSIAPWIEAFRLRTLPLAVSGILMAVFLSFFMGHLNVKISLLALITAVLLQILSNLANDFGDYQKGTDNSNRVGPERTVQGGKISPGAMKKAIVVFILLSLLSGISLVWLSLGNVLTINAILVLTVGVLSILAALKYTVGRKAFGYNGFGDLAVFLFFGIVAVAGGFYLNTKELFPMIVLPASSIGFLSVGVLNLNNMRDIHNDKASGKHTLAVRLGGRGARIYHFVLILLAFMLFTAFNVYYFDSYYQFIYLFTIPFFVSDILKVDRTKEPSELDPFLKKHSVNTLLFTLLSGLGIILNAYA